MLSITPTLPGLINNINPKINVGNASFLFDVSWLYGVRCPTCVIALRSSRIFLQFFSAGGVYLILSKTFPAQETFMDMAILVENDTGNASTEEFSSTDADKKDKTDISVASL